MTIDVTVQDASDGIDVTVTGGATDTRVNVSDSGTQVVANPTDINFDQNLTVTDDGDDTVTVDATGGGGSAVEVQEDGTSLTTDVTLFDFLTGLTASEPAADEIDVTLDESVLKDGGALEIDAAEFAAASGTNGQFLQSDGAAASWATAAFADLSGSASLAQLSEILDGNNDVEADHLAAANLPSHASRHQDGGADELDVANLAGALGTSGQVPQSDGAAVSWVSLPHSDLASVGADDHHPQIDAQDDGVSVVDGPDVINFAGSYFDVTNPVGSTIDVTLTNDSVTVTAGDGLTGGGSVSLGGSVTLDAGLDIEDGGVDVIAAHGINFGSNLSVTDDADGTVTVDASGGSGNLTDSGFDNAGGHDLYELPNTGDGILLTGDSADEGLLHFDADGDRDTYFGLEDDFNNVKLVVKGNTMMKSTGAGPDIEFPRSDTIVSGGALRIDGAAFVIGSTRIQSTPFDEASKGSSNGDIGFHDGTGDGIKGLYSHDGTTAWFAQGVTETANAETPQGTYRTGQIVYFTDSGDGSGDGVYIIDDTNTPQQIN